MGWDPIGDLKKGVENVGKTVNNAVSSVSNTVNHTLDTSFSSIGRTWDTNREQFERSDIGRVGRAVTMPIHGVTEGLKFAAGGDLGKGMNAMIGGVANANPINMALNSSSTLKQWAASDTVNNLTGGLSLDAVRANDALGTLRRGDSLTGSQYSDLVRYGIRSAVYATGVGYAADAGWVDKAVTWGADNPLTVLAAGDKIAKGNYAGAAAAVADESLGTGKLFQTITSPPPAARTPASYSQQAAQSPYPTQGPSESYTFGGVNNTIFMVLAAVGVLILALVMRRR